nr:LruC domain-containing protein [Bacteroidota bacterium]
MRFLPLILIASLSVLFVTSCKKTVDTPVEADKSFENLQVPDGFTWSTLDKSAFVVQIVNAGETPTGALNGYPLDATDMHGNLLQRSSIIDGQARFLLELNKSIETIRLYSPSHEISQDLSLKSENKTFKLTETLKSVKAFEDADSDGVFDDFDDYPNDPDKAYTVYYPSPYRNSDLKSGDETYETWYYQMFEDLWPNKGDYDLNDLVLKLRMDTVFNGQGHWAAGSFDFYIWTNGAGIDLGLGIEFFDYLENVEDKIRLKYLQPGQLTLTPGSYDPAHTGVDPDVSNGIIVFSNA